MGFFSFIKTKRIERDEFAQDVLSHVDALYAVGFRMTRNAMDAEDLVQDTLLKAVRSREQFEVGTNLKAWLFKIQTNTFINKYHRGGLERDVVDGPDARSLSDGWMSASTMNQMMDPESMAFRPIVEKEVSAALNTLPDDYRLVVMLSDVEDFSYKEIADIMGCPIGTVMSRLNRGRRMLQEKLYDHAVSMGIIEDRGIVGAEEVAVDLAEYRARKRGVG